MRRVIGTVAVAVACLALAACNSHFASPNSGDPSASQTIPALTSSCGLFYGGYALTFTNPGTQPVQVTGFSVTFTSNGQETGSDSEPGNGTITDPDTNGPTETIGMNDVIAAGDSFTYEVQLSDMPPADACALANWTDQ